MVDVVSERDIARAARTLAENAASPATVIIFGSYARGEGGPDSDLDFLVVEREVESRIREAGRLRRSLPFLGVPIDVLVVSEDHAERWRNRPGSVVHEALKEGRVLESP